MSPRFETLSEEGLQPVLQAIRSAGIKDVSPWTATRWCVCGVGNGELKLEAVKVGRRWYSTKAAVLRFIDQQNSPGNDARRGRKEATLARRSARAELESRGMGPRGEGS